MWHPSLPYCYFAYRVVDTCILFMIILGAKAYLPVQMNAGIDHKTATEQGETETPLLEDTNKISGAHHDPGGRCRGLNQTYL